MHPPTPALPIPQPPQPKWHGSDTTTHNIRVFVSPRYLTDPSMWGEAAKAARYVFSYAINIRNRSHNTVQLLSRRWLIVDAVGRAHEVEGEGVVGQQPIIEPGTSFDYTSFCPLSTPWGTMEGSFRFTELGGPEFDVAIGRFFLVSE